MRKSIIAPLAIAAPLALLGAVPAETATTRTVRVGDNFFVRAAGAPAVTVRRGDRVRWRWTGSSPHNVTVTSGPTRFRSRTQSSGTFTRRVTRPGTYRIICTIHGAPDQSMRLRVR
jgi:plastocyanin